MKLMSLVKGLVLVAMLACVARAEVRTIQLDTRSVAIFAQRAIVEQIDHLIQQGWRVISVSYAGPSHVTFVLESPTKETVK